MKLDQITKSASEPILNADTHDTPEHGSWLNIAQCALSVLSRQCLNRRIADLNTLQSEVAAWEKARNRYPHTVKWQFRAEDARIKLKRFYPIQSDKTP